MVMVAMDGGNNNDAFALPSSDDGMLLVVAKVTATRAASGVLGLLVRSRTT